MLVNDIGDGILLAALKADGSGLGFDLNSLARRQRTADLLGFPPRQRDRRRPARTDGLAFARSFGGFLLRHELSRTKLLRSFKRHGREVLPHSLKIWIPPCGTRRRPRFARVFGFRSVRRGVARDHNGGREDDHQGTD